ncbi:MAG: hypothetical protein WCJ33_01870, partial [Pseudomonadota bacterium]
MDELSLTMLDIEASIGSLISSSEDEAVSTAWMKKAITCYQTEYKFTIHSKYLSGTGIAPSELAKKIVATVKDAVEHDMKIIFLQKKWFGLGKEDKNGDIDIDFYSSDEVFNKTGKRIIEYANDNPNSSIANIVNQRRIGNEKALSRAIESVNDTFKNIFIPKPNERMSVSEEDNSETACNKIDAFFENLIEGYDNDIKQLAQEMYYKNKNVNVIEGLYKKEFRGRTSISTNNNKIELLIQIDSEINRCPISSRLIKIHEIIHVIQSHEIFNMHGNRVFKKDYFPKTELFLEQSVSLTEKILFDSIPIIPLRLDNPKIVSVYDSE